MSDAVRL